MSLLQARIIARIKGSPHRLTLHFPPAPAAVVATPANPFGPTGTATAIPAATTPSFPDKVVHCLWADGVNAGDLASRAEQIMRREVGWYAEATVVARVLVSEVAIDATKPYGATWLDRVQRVSFGGKTYEIVQYTPVSAGFLVPVSYAVWLKGAQQQSS